MFDADELRPVRDRTAQDQPGEGVSRFAHLRRCVMRMHLADMREVRAYLRQEICGGLGVRLARIPGNPIERRRPRVVVENEMFVGEVVVTQRRIVGAWDAQDRRAARPSSDKHGGKLIRTETNARGAAANEGIECPHLSGTNFRIEERADLAL